jgi:RNA polymerase sigma-70 factor (ECF subfamily)
MGAMTRVADTDRIGVIESAAAGDEAAFERIVTTYHAQMHRVCVFVSGDQTIAEEAVQAAWVIAWRKLGSLQDPRRLGPWLVSVAVNQAKDLLRKRRRRTEVEVPSDISLAAGGVDPATGIDSMDLRAALRRLDPDERALLAMRYVAGFSSTELAEVIGITPSGTRNRLERLTTRLRQELE